MSSDVEQLVREVRKVTGAEGPRVLEADGPVLDLESQRHDEMYLVGLIGGKDVGKSALVNALVGQKITAETAHGAGTEIVVAYAHQSQEAALRELLEGEVPGKYRIVTHRNDSLRQQVLVDLPDVDSHWQGHLEVTRRMLRQMLFPIWIASVEKYADAKLMEILRRVAEGNSPENFLFCLNKVDQLDASAANDLQVDFTKRLQKALSLPTDPMVRLISATHPDEYDLPDLRNALAREKSADSVEESGRLAKSRQLASVARWLGDQRLSHRSQRLARLQADAQELLDERVGTELLERVVPQIVDDPARRLGIIDECQRLRAARWPIVNVLQAALTPLLLLVKHNLTSAAGLDETRSREFARVISASFAQLQQQDAQIASLYGATKMWETMAAEQSAAKVIRSVRDCADQQREVIVDRVARRRNPLAAMVRWLLTLGALLWFPLVQPMLEAMLRDGFRQSITYSALLVVQVLGVTYLLKNVTFLIIYFLALWMIIRWDTQRRVDKLLRKIAAGKLKAAPVASSVAMQWMDELLQPISQARERMEALAQREEEFKKRVA